MSTQLTPTFTVVTFRTDNATSDRVTQIHVDLHGNVIGVVVYHNFESGMALLQPDGTFRITPGFHITSDGGRPNQLCCYTEPLPNVGVCQRRGITIFDQSTGEPNLIFAGREFAAAEYAWLGGDTIAIAEHTDWSCGHYGGIYLYRHGVLDTLIQETFWATSDDGRKYKTNPKIYGNGDGSLILVHNGRVMRWAAEQLAAPLTYVSAETMWNVPDGMFSTAHLCTKHPLCPYLIIQTSRRDNIADQMITCLDVRTKQVLWTRAQQNLSSCAISPCGQYAALVTLCWNDLDKKNKLFTMLTVINLQTGETIWEHDYWPLRFTSCQWLSNNRICILYPKDDLGRLITTDVLQNAGIEVITLNVVN